LKATGNNLQSTISKMTFSASGWRGVFSQDGDGESKNPDISDDHKTISALAGIVFADHLKSRQIKKPSIIVGMDSRPTGPEIASALIKALLSQNCDIIFTGICAAPEIMAFARSFGNIDPISPEIFNYPENTNCSPHIMAASKKSPSKADAFILISASHNPIGYNGLKFGLLDGGVLNGNEVSKLIDRFNEYINKDKIKSFVFNLLNSVSNENFNAIMQKRDFHKKNALTSYREFIKQVITGRNGNKADILFQQIQNALKKYPIGIAADFNGSARAESIDKDFFSSLNINFSAINDKSGEIVHRIVPEGQSLIPCCLLLENQNHQDSHYILAYVPDCDGDRGNLVLWDNKQNKARALEGQEVFSLCCVSEFAHLVWTGEVSYDDCGKPQQKIAVAVNDATSLRIDKIAAFFGVETYRAETGEANVVSLARNLRDRGYAVRILGEGAAGGNITHPSAVRDPIATVMALVKLFSIRSNETQKGFFEIWCEKSGQLDKYKQDFSFSDIIETLPPFVTTNAYSPEAVLIIKATNHSILKKHYQEVFEKEWQNKKHEFKHKYNITGFFVSGFNGTEERCPIVNWEESGRGGLKITFYNGNNTNVAAIWMRGSGTEPVFRIMADVDGNNLQFERALIEWQREMVLEADKQYASKRE
jgi:phosphoglucomutase